MKPRSAKAKGTRLEKLIAKMLVDSGLDKYAQRMPLSGAVAGLKADIYTKLPLQIECKNQEKWSPYEWYQQALSGRNSGSGKIPVVFMSRNNVGAYAFLEAQDFVNIMYHALKGGLE